MRYIFLHITLLFICVTSGAQTSSNRNHHKRDTISKLSVQILPDRLIPVFTADARAHRLQLQRSLNSSEFFGSMGGQFPVVNLKAFDKTLQIGVASTVYTTLKRYVKRGETVNVDYFADLFFDLQLNRNWLLRSSYGHTSQHLSDDAIAAGLTPINYVKDYVQLHSVHRLFKQRLLLYGGFYYFHNFKIWKQGIAQNLSGHTLWQVGTEYTIFQFNKSNSIYIAGDIKFREEFDFGNTHCFQAGYKLSVLDDTSLRLAYQYLGGYEERGQFFTNKTNFHTIALLLDL